MSRALEERIGYRFRDRRLLLRALTHRSYADVHMERLEFLGDAVLGLIISEALYRRLAAADEGRLTRLRAALVCRASLIEVGRAWRLEAALRVGAGERDRTGQLKSSAILADAVEALIAAVFLDGGWEAASRLVLDAWRPQLAQLNDGADVRDAKTRLQEFTQAQGWGLPSYEVEDRGGGTKPRFFARCLVRARVCGEGLGRTKKAAEMAAARQALQTLQQPVDA